MKKLTITENTYNAICELNQENQYELLIAICEYGIRGVQPDLKGQNKLLFSLIEPSLGISKVIAPKTEKSERVAEFAKLVKAVADKSISQMDLIKFIGYWTESSPNGRLLRFEKEKCFDVRLRLNTWMSNQRKWNPQTQTQNKNQVL